MSDSVVDDRTPFWGQTPSGSGNLQWDFLFRPGHCWPCHISADYFPRCIAAAATVGVCVGDDVGPFVGPFVGSFVGACVDAIVGSYVGAFVGRGRGGRSCG